VRARAGPEVDDIIGVPHGFFVMLNHEQRVPARLEALERVEQLLVIARMQADGRFVENVEHPAEVRAELGGQANALRFPPLKRGDTTAQVEVAEPDFLEKFQAFTNLGQDVARNERLAALEFDAAKQFAGASTGRREKSSMVGMPPALRIRAGTSPCPEARAGAAGPSGQVG